MIAWVGPFQLTGELMYSARMADIANMLVEKGM